MSLYIAEMHANIYEQRALLYRFILKIPNSIILQIRNLFYSVV